MLRWLALSLLGLLMGCEGPGDWGGQCKAYREKVRTDCEKYGKNGAYWQQVCPGYLDAIEKMEKSIPPEGTIQKKYDAAEPACSENLQKFEDTTKSEVDFPRKPVPPKPPPTPPTTTPTTPPAGTPPTTPPKK